MVFRQSHDQLINLKIKADAILLLLAFREVPDHDLVRVALRQSVKILLANYDSIIYFEIA